MQHEKLLKYSLLSLVLILILIISINGKKKNAQWVGSNKNTVIKEKITLHLAGAIKNPGLYTVPYTMRYKEVLDEAGGFLDTANVDKVNLASYPKDGQRLYIPYKKSAKKRVRKSYKKISPVSLNSGTSLQLQTLPYIGKKTAVLIIEYRTKEGPFKTINELKNIKGIGEKTIEKIKEYCLL